MSNVQSLIDKYESEISNCRSRLRNCRFDETVEIASRMDALKDVVSDLKQLKEE